MNNQLHQAAVKQAAKGQFRGNKKIRSRYIPLYPESSERQMRRIANSYMKIITDELKDAVPEILKIYEQQSRKDSRMDGISDLRKAISQRFSKAKDSISKKIEDFSLQDKLDMAAAMIKNTALREWKKTVRKTLKLELLDDYYQDEMYQEAIKQWVSEGSDAMGAVPQDLMEQVKDIIETGFMKGTPASQIRKEIQRAYYMKRTELAHGAAGRVSVLNSECTRINQEDAGVREYMWVTRRDSRVRKCHATLDGRYFRWDNPPEMWYETKAKGRVMTGRHCNPGEDYGCRCSAIPRFDIETINLPISNPQKGGEKRA